MRHHDKNRKFGRPANQRKALLRTLAEGLILRGRIKTTLAKAKEMRGFIEPIITKGKAGTVASRKLVITRLGTEARAKDLITKVVPKYTDRRGGYTRIIKTGLRKSDGAPMAIIELV